MEHMEEENLKPLSYAAVFQEYRKIKTINGIYAEGRDAIGLMWELPELNFGDEIPYDGSLVIIPRLSSDAYYFDVYLGEPHSFLDEALLCRTATSLRDAINSTLDQGKIYLVPTLVIPLSAYSDDAVFDGVLDHHVAYRIFVEK